MKKNKVLKLCIVGAARPNFVKIAPIIHEIRKFKNIKYVLVYTGQHSDPEMAGCFFKDLNIPEPTLSLNISEGDQTSKGKKLKGFVKSLPKLLMFFKRVKPDFVVVVGDVTSTLYCTMVAKLSGIRVVHVESGCRSFDSRMPEEFNRIWTDKLSDVLFCVTRSNARQLMKEGIKKNIFVVGDVMYDVLLHNFPVSKKSNILDRLCLNKKNYVLVTLHRAENADFFTNMQNIVFSLVNCGEKIVLPLHPRTNKMLRKYGLYDKLKNADNVLLTEPLNYFDFQKLLMEASKLLTDSGGVQKEAYYLGVPCITIRQSTEWVETILEGWNVLVDANYYSILGALKSFNPSTKQTNVFGNGDSSRKILEVLNENLD